jgi:hypothetical protein
MRVTMLIPCAMEKVCAVPPTISISGAGAAALVKDHVAVELTFSQSVTLRLRLYVPACITRFVISTLTHTHTHTHTERERERERKKERDIERGRES